MKFTAPRIDLNWYAARIRFVDKWWVEDLQ
jgi:hypothetical protein